jgi:hypothetical protein
VTGGGAGQYVLDFQIDPNALERRRVEQVARRPLVAGQVRFRVDRFALTANNITYASTGSSLGYLDFFPMDIERPWRRIPVMGHAEIVESAHPEIEAGGRYFGFYPMAGEHVITADRRGANVWDAGAHRERHAATYRQFEDVRGDPQYDPGREDVFALLRGLFVTSYLVDDFLFDNSMFGAESVVVTSASSKTSIALGYCLRRRGTPSIGLTSARNLEAVRKLECYDDVRTYEDVSSLDAGVPTVVVDMAGDGGLLGAIHGHFGDALRYSCAVGGTHRAAGPRPMEMAGPAPQFFFAPSQIKKRSAEWGAAEFMGRLRESFREFAAYSDGWLEVVRGSGAEAVDRAYAEVLEGRSSPSVGHMLSLPSD